MLQTHNIVYALNTKSQISSSGLYTTHHNDLNNLPSNNHESWTLTEVSGEDNFPFGAAPNFHFLESQESTQHNFLDL